MYYYNYNVLCNMYLKGGCIACNEEMYARSRQSLANKVRRSFRSTYGISLKDAEPIRIEINYTDDPNSMKGAK